MRRVLAGMVAVLVLAGGCSSDKAGKDDAESKRTTSTPSTAAPVTSSSAPQSSECAGGIGAAPASGQAQVTWLAGGRLLGAAPRAGAAAQCLAEAPSGTTGVQWGGNGDRVLLGTTVVFGGSKAAQAFSSGERAVLSRPTGKAVLEVLNGKLEKKELDAGQLHLEFMERHDAAVYHPAGRHIVSWGQADGRAGLWIASNTGGDAREVVTNESGVKAFTGVAWTASGALLYVADHGDHVDLHRLVIGEDTFSTVASVRAPGTIGAVTASPFEGGGVAWTAGDCAAGSMKLVAERGGKYFKLDGTEAAGAAPAGWLPDGTLVAVSGQACSPGQAGKVLLVHPAGGVDVLAEGATAAAVRAVLPPPPAPPKNIPQAAPA